MSGLLIDLKEEYAGEGSPFVLCSEHLEEHEFEEGDRIFVTSEEHCEDCQRGTNIHYRWP